MGKNLQRVQDMLDGTYGGKTQVGYGDQDSKHRSVGDKWTDSDGYEWEQKEGFQVKISKMPAVGLFSKQCKDCKKNCSSKTAKPWDRDSWKADGRCRECQINFEAELKGSQSFNGKPGVRWFAYRRLRDLRNMDAIEKEMVSWIEEMEKQKEQNPFDETVANAMANGEVNMSIKKNTK